MILIIKLMIVLRVLFIGSLAGRCFAYIFNYNLSGRNYFLVFIIAIAAVCLINALDIIFSISYITQSSRYADIFLVLGIIVGYSYYCKPKLKQSRR